MAVSDTAKLIVDLSLKGNFVRQMGGATKTLDAFTKGESRAFKAGAQIGTGIRNAGKIAAVGIAALTSQVALGLDSLIKLEKATVQTEAVIKSTGGAAGQSAEGVRRLAEQYESLNATMGDEIIQSGANVLLTFTNIRKKAFEPALEAALDLSVAMDQDLQSSIVQVGKALNDPIRGITALRRVGVQLSEAQEEQIKTLVEQNDLYGAQRVILAELNKEFGGSFLAQGTTTAGKVAKFTDSIEDLQRSLATALLPTVSNVADALSEFLADPAVVKGAEDLGVEIGKMFSKENVKSGIDALRGVFNTAREVAPIVAAAAKTMGGFISTAVAAFKSLPPEIQNLAIAGFALNKLTGGLVTNIGGGLIGAVLKQLKSAVVTVHGGVVNVSGPGIGGGGVPAAGGKGVGAIGAVARLLPITIAAFAPLAIAQMAGAPPINPATVEKGGGFGGRGGGHPSRLTGVLDQIAVNTKNTSRNTTPKPGDREHEGSGIRRDAVKNAIDKATTAVETMRGSIGDSLGNIKTSTIEAGLRAKQGAEETKAQVASSAMVQQALLGSQIATTMTTAFGTQGAVRSVAPPIVGAIRANRPVITTIVNVTATHVTKQTTIQSRYGPGSGSGGQNQRSGELEY